MKEIKRLFWLNAAFYLIFGCCLLTMPNLGLSTIVAIFAIGALIFGIIGIAFSIKHPWIENRALIGISSILSALLGLLLICFPSAGETIILVFVVLIGIALSIGGVALIIESFDAKRRKVSNWYWFLVMGIVITLIGLFIANNSLLTTLIFNSLVGLSMISAGVGMVIWAFQMKKNVKRIKKELENIDEIEIEVR